jgi:hypothetical protein
VALPDLAGSSANLSLQAGWTWEDFHTCPSRYLIWTMFVFVAVDVKPALVFRSHAVFANVSPASDLYYRAGAQNAWTGDGIPPSADIRP